MRLAPRLVPSLLLVSMLLIAACDELTMTRPVVTTASGQPGVGNGASQQPPTGRSPAPVTPSTSPAAAPPRTVASLKPMPTPVAPTPTVSQTPVALISPPASPSPVTPVSAAPGASPSPSTGTGGPILFRLLDRVEVAPFGLGHAHALIKSQARLNDFYQARLGQFGALAGINFATEELLAFYDPGGESLCTPATLVSATETATDRVFAFGQGLNFDGDCEEDGGVPPGYQFVAVPRSTKPARGIPEY